MMIARGSLVFWIAFAMIVWAIWKFVIRERFRSEVDE